MGTDWKKSKLAARILCGWLGMMSLLAALLCLLACGPAMLGGSSVGMGDLLAGQLSGSVYYQEKMAELFYNCSLLAAGGAAGDGTPLTAGQNTQLRSQAREALNNDSGALSSGQVLFAVLPDSESGVSYSNTDFALWEDGRVAAPLGYSVALASTSGSSWGNRALLAAYTRLLTSQTVHPSAEGLENAVVVLAVQDGAGPWLPGFVGEGLRQVETLRPHLILFLSGCTLALGCGVVCLGWRRRALPARAWAASLTGRIWLEAKLLVWAAALFCLWVWQAVYVPDALWTVLPALLWPLVWLTAVDLRFNGAGVFRCSLLARLAGLARGSWRAQPWQRRVAGPAVLCWLAPVVMVPMLWLMFFTCYWAAPGLVLFALVLGHLAALAILLAGLALQLRFCRDAGRLTGTLHTLRSEGAAQPLHFKPSAPLHDAAEDLNALREGIDAAVEQQRRADRMKMELLTNVSHDLKTPLTSIINYADLLCAEPLEGAAADYAKVIQRKADRLKHMVQDVFDLSKAASGSLPLSPEAIDLSKLIRQTLADMDEAIAASPLTFRTTLAPEAWVLADGERMYRVFQNLFSNALRYSLAGSRVYVDLSAENGQAVARVKNVAGYEMEFDPAEITERFVRGDPSRTGEGSGLGLSIAKSFTEACGGTLEVRVDADLFCVQVALPLTEKPAPAEAGSESGPSEACEAAAL